MRLDDQQASRNVEDRRGGGGGIGRGRHSHILMLLNQLHEFTKLNVPILVGLSRKSMLGAITGNKVSDRIHESIAAALLAISKGAKIVRVHDVKASKDAFAVCTAMQTRNDW